MPAVEKLVVFRELLNTISVNTSVPTHVSTGVELTQEETDAFYKELYTSYIAVMTDASDAEVSLMLKLTEVFSSAFVYSPVTNTVSILVNSYIKLCRVTSLTLRLLGFNAFTTTKNEIASGTKLDSENVKFENELDMSTDEKSGDVKKVITNKVVQTIDYNSGTIYIASGKYSTLSESVRTQIITSTGIITSDIIEYVMSRTNNDVTIYGFKVNFVVLDEYKAPETPQPVTISKSLLIPKCLLPAVSAAKALSTRVPAAQAPIAQARALNTGNSMSFRK